MSLGRGTPDSHKLTPLGNQMTVVTFIVTGSRQGSRQFTVFRIRDERMSIVAHFETLHEAKLAAERYVDQARYAGLNARVVLRDR